MGLLKTRVLILQNLKNRMVVSESEKITMELKTYTYTTALQWKGFSGKVFRDFEAFIGVIALS